VYLVLIKGGFKMKHICEMCGINEIEQDEVLCNECKEEVKNNPLGDDFCKRLGEALRPVKWCGKDGWQYDDKKRP
jgi:predicted amidophosphoribosyltransferase